MVLYGPKGAGKSHIGGILEDHFGIPFLRVEAIFLKHKKGRAYNDPNYIKEAVQEVQEELQKLLNSKGSAAFETLGVVPRINQMVEDLSTSCKVISIGVAASYPVCVSRIENRDASQHLPADEKLLMIAYNRASEVLQRRQFQLMLDNSSSLSKEEIIEQIQAVL